MLTLKFGWDSELKSDYCGESTQRLGPIFPLTHSTKMTGFNPPLHALPLIPLLSQLLVQLLPMILVHDHLMILLGGPSWLAFYCYQGGLTTTSGQLKFIKVWLLGLTVANCHFENSFGSFFMLMSLLRVWLVGANSKRSLLWKSNMPLSVQGSITIPGIGGRFRFCLSWNDFFATFAFDCRLEWQWIRLWKMIAI